MTQDAGTDQVFGGITQQVRRPAVDIQEFAVFSEGHVSVRRLLVEVPVASLALHQPLLDPQPLELDGRAGGEDPEDEEPARLGRHGPLVEHGQVSEDVPPPSSNGTPR